MSRDHGARVSDLAAPPDDITDPLLWRLATDVAAAHQTGADGRCRNLQCADQPRQCAAGRNARRALHLARTTPPAAVHRPTPPPPAVARGRATVTTTTGRFPRWFTRTATTAAVNRWDNAISRLPHRVPGAALAAAA
jgi:hypothetical protein